MIGAQTNSERRPPLTQRQAAAMCNRFRLDGPDDLPVAGLRVCYMEGKAKVVAAVVHGLLDEDAACERYALSPLEFRIWRRLVEHSSYIPA